LVAAPGRNRVLPPELDQEKQKMRIVLLSVIAALGLAASAAASPASDPQSAPRATTLSLDSFTLSPDVTYSENNFWCEFNDYGTYFAGYTGLCPSQAYVATVHWKKVPNVTEYYVCVEPVFHDYSPGFSCYVALPPRSGNPASLSMTFDSAAQFLNAFQGTTQVWMVETCNSDPVTNESLCTESNTVSSEIPWTG
jgi:hypothetical protein